uniref:Uncharacterized protein n=1 Tax=Anguilla anguilla TaxID=7936 RepID=A0A0E9WD20_ANGAN
MFKGLHFRLTGEISGVLTDGSVGAWSLKPAISGNLRFKPVDHRTTFQLEWLYFIALYTLRVRVRGRVRACVRGGGTKFDPLT